MSDHKPLNVAQYLKVEDQVARLSPIEALAACLNIASMISYQLDLSEDEVVEILRDMYRELDGSMRKGQSWIAWSREVEPSLKH